MGGEGGEWEERGRGVDGKLSANLCVCVQVQSVDTVAAQCQSPPLPTLA